jgi:TPR repeat protein
MKDKAPEVYFSCCGKYICGGCMHSFRESGNDEKCPFCNSDRGKTEEEDNEDLMKRVEANDAFAMFVVGNHYMEGQLGLHQDREKAMELWTQAAELGSSHAHYQLGFIYEEEGDLKKAKFHNEAAALFVHNTGRYNLGCMEFRAGNVERAVKHWTIAASGGEHDAMQNLLIQFKYGALIRHTIDSTLTANNSSCKEMRSEARDTSIRNEE